MSLGDGPFEILHLSEVEKPSGKKKREKLPNCRLVGRFAKQETGID